MASRFLFYSKKTAFSEHRVLHGEFEELRREVFSPELLSFCIDQMTCELVRPPARMARIAQKRAIYFAL